MRWNESVPIENEAPGPRGLRDYGDLHALTREIKGLQFGDAKQALDEMLQNAFMRGKAEISRNAITPILRPEER